MCACIYNPSSHQLLFQSTAKLGPSPTFVRYEEYWASLWHAGPWYVGCLCVCLSIYMVVSLILCFKLYAFIRVKGFQKRSINMVNFLFEGGFCLCICVPKFVSFWMLVCLSAVARIYIYMYICACSGMDLYI